jgi:hypothetical protein
MHTKFDIYFFITLKQTKLLLTLFQLNYFFAISFLPDRNTEKNHSDLCQRFEADLLLNNMWFVFDCPYFRNFWNNLAMISESWFPRKSLNTIGGCI